VGTDLVTHNSIDDDIRLANALAQSGFYKDIKDAAAGVVKLRIAREFGLGLKGISDVHIDEECVEIEWTINGEVIGTSKCDTDDAKRMGLAGRGTWQKYPRQMRTARAVTEGVNAFMPEVIGGSIYTPEELGDDSGINGGEGGASPSKVASSGTILPSSTLTLKPAETEDAVVEAMVVEAIKTMDAAEETVEGEVIDPTPGWVEAAKAFFASLAKEEKLEAGKLLKIHGYLPEGKLTQEQVYESLAETLGVRCAELDIVIKELAA
jgi:hypothetical protein